jgi:Mrp family chromosome partitioning ATPase
VTLQSQAPRDGGCRSYLVSSASPGEGKTSLTMALGLSFAASQMRTLVIDGDIVGRGLTSGLQASQVKGLYEALAAGNLRGLVRKAAGGVHVLCAGNVGSTDACGLSPAAVGALLEQARHHFDVVLIDSGPVMGSVEAAVFAPEVDGVIFTIARGQRPAVVQKAQQRLDALGARIAGVVFNRAQPKDFHRSPFGSSSASSSSASSSDASRSAALPEAPKFTRFGPLVQAVACGMPSLHP